MAHSKQASKRLRQAERRTVINRSRRSRVRTYVRRIEDALADFPLDPFGQCHGRRGVVPQAFELAGGSIRLARTAGPFNFDLVMTFPPALAERRDRLDRRAESRGRRP